MGADYDEDRPARKPLDYKRSLAVQRIANQVFTALTTEALSYEEMERVMGVVSNLLAPEGTHGLRL